MFINFYVHILGVLLMLFGGVHKKTLEKTSLRGTYVCDNVLYFLFLLCLFCQCKSHHHSGDEKAAIAYSDVVIYKTITESNS